MTPEALVQLMLKYRVQRAKASIVMSEVPGNDALEVLEFELHPSAFGPAANAVEAPATAPIGALNGGYPTNEELLFASSPFPLTREELNASPPPEKP